MKFDKYDRLGAYHWKAYENDPEYRAHVDHVVEWIPKGKILDVGAGDGLIASKIGAVGIDSNKTAVYHAKRNGANVSFGSAYKLGNIGPFDSVYLGDVIEHLETPEKALLEIHRVLSKGGALYVVWPTPGIVDEYAEKAYSVKDLVEVVERCGFALDGDVYTIKSRTYAKFRKA